MADVPQIPDDVMEDTLGDAPNSSLFISNLLQIYTANIKFEEDFYYVLFYFGPGLALQIVFSIFAILYNFVVNASLAFQIRQSNGVNEVDAIFINHIR